jgi:Cu-Zn family superoxide dismutase
VSFEGDDGATSVRLKLQAVPAGAATNAFHGFHLHANNDAANGSGCVADPTAPSNTWFVSADGHWSKDPADHAAHTGDLPTVLVLPDGSADIRFRTARFDPSELDGRAVILHAGPDNYGNVPVGAGPTQYTPNSAAAGSLTARTGNAGDRIGCGVVEIG